MVPQPRRSEVRDRRRVGKPLERERWRREEEEVGTWFLRRRSEQRDGRDYRWVLVWAWARSLVVVCLQLQA